MSDSNNISIHVIGKPGVGKSTVIDLINRMLRMHGLNTVIHQLGGEALPAQSSETDRINSMVRKVTLVDIHELPRRVERSESKPPVAAPAPAPFPLSTAEYGVPIVPIVGKDITPFATYLKDEGPTKDGERPHSVIVTQVSDQIWVDTLPLKVGVPVSLLGLSEAEGLMEMGLIDPTDRVEEPVVLDSIFLRLTPSAPLFQVKLNSNLPEYTLKPPSNANKHGKPGRPTSENRHLSNGTRDVQLDIPHAKIRVDLLNKADIMGDRIPEFSLSKHMEIVVDLRVRVSLDLGTAVMDPSAVIVNSITSENGTDANLRMFELMTLEGYTLKAHRGNTNRRRRPG